MSETAKLLDLVGDIYDAALESALWMGVLEKAADFVGGSAASIFSQDTVYKFGNSSYHFGIDPQYEKLYFDKYIKYNPLNTAFLVLNAGEVTSSSVLIPPGEFFETRFYKEWAAPQGWIDNVFAILDKSQTSIGSFVIFRHEREGLADENARRLLSLITPHLRRAALIGKVINLKASEAATFANVLDNISAGIFLVDAEGRIVHANAAGHDILVAGDVLLSFSGRLVARDPPTNKALHDAVAAAEHGDAAVDVQGVAMPLIALNGARHVAHLLPLTSGDRRRTGVATAATSALFVRKAAIEAPSRPEVIARTYRLTPTELRVLFAIVDIGGVPEVAETLGIAASTVRTHLRQVYKRLASRVRPISSSSSPDSPAPSFPEPSPPPIGGGEAGPSGPSSRYRQAHHGFTIL